MSPSIIEINGKTTNEYFEQEKIVIKQQQHEHNNKQYNIKFNNNKLNNSISNGSYEINNSNSHKRATATPKPPTLNVNDIFISVKTTKQNHDNRLELILKTWQQLAKHQVRSSAFIIIIIFNILNIIVKWVKSDV